MSAPQLLRLPLQADGLRHTLLVVADGRVAQPPEGLLQAHPFAPEGDGGMETKA